MSFLIASDFSALIPDSILQSVIDQDDVHLQTAISYAQEEVFSYLAQRYDTDAIFAAVDQDRNPLIVMRMADIALYHLYARRTPREISQLRDDRYNDAIEWLKMVASGKVNPNLPIKALSETDDQETLFRIGSNSKFNSEY